VFLPLGLGEGVSPNLKEGGLPDLELVLAAHQEGLLLVPGAPAAGEGPRATGLGEE
jgi:hypothetical protein